MKKTVVLLGFMFFIASNVYAARPLSTDDAGVVEVGAWEMEYGFEYVNDFDDEYNQSVVLKTGVLKNVDIGIEIPYQFIEVEGAKDVNGFSDLVFTTKWNIFSDQNFFPDVALAFSYKTESGNDGRGLGTGRPEYAFTGVFSKAIERFTYHVNLGCSVKHEFEDTLNYNVALEYALNEKTNLVGEIFGDTILTGKFDSNAASGLVGFNYAFTESIAYDLGLVLGISDADPEYKVAAGLTFVF